MQATGEGFFFFHPEDISDNTCIPQIIVIDFKVRNEEFRTDSGIVSKKHLRLKHNENFFSFEFAALDYVCPEKNQFAYFLEGLEDDWVYSGNRRYVSYSSVPPGNYVFRVKGSNNDGYWNETGTSLAITILPPPWRTWWAYFLYGIAILGLITAWRSYDLNRQRLKHQLALEHLEAQKLKELDSTKSRFFANISHEFRTPLTLVLGPLDKLRAIVPKEAERDLEIMQRNARRLQHLINQLLLLSRLEAGQMKLKAKELNIVKLVNGYVQSFESLAKQKRIELVFHSAEKEIMAFVDRDKMEKILYNLLSNAFKYTPAGGKISVEIGQLDSWAVGQKYEILSNCPTAQLPNLSSNYVTVSITDTGPGIPPEHLPHIFDRFYQADDSSPRRQEGTGIGLALVKELVELHHGKISAESEPGSGTNITIVLPLGSGHLKAEEITTEMDPEQLEERDADLILAEQGTAKSPGERKKLLTEVIVSETKAGQVPLIMVVEDNADLREYIRGFLLASYHLVEAADGEEAWQEATVKIPDLVISDVMMPKMDGFELCQKLKNDERTSHIPVILLTAKAEVGDKLEGLETGADDFIIKPFNTEELQIRIKNLLKQREKLKEQFLKEAGRTGLAFLLDMPEDKILSMDEKFMQKAVRIITENMEDPEFSVEDFASRMAMSHVQLHRKLVALTGQPANRLIRTVRLTKAAQLIKNKSATITEIAYEVGFNNLSWFARCFHEQFGLSPSEYASQTGSR
jgi:signal transduction histidine kinase/DNA-binding response OmpR family regulator